MTKQQSLIHGFIELAQRYGPTLTGVDTIALHTKVSKKTIYNYFGSKDALVAHAMQQFSDEIRQSWKSEWHTIPNKLDLILARFDELETLIINDRFYGCLFIQTCKEFPDQSHDLHKISMIHKTASQEETRNRLINLDRSLEHYATHIELIFEGLLAKLLVEQDLQLIHEAKAIVKGLLSGFK